MQPEANDKSRLCLNFAADGLTAYCNREALIDLRNQLDWLIASPPEDNYHCHVLTTLENDASRFDGIRPRNAGVTFSEGVETMKDADIEEAICEAVTRQTMRFVPIKSREQQAALSLHRVRQLLIKQRTQLVNMMRSVLAELGTTIPVGIVKALQMAREIVDGESELDLPPEAANVVAMLAGQLLQLHAQLRKLDLRLAALQRSDDRARRLATIPGIGPIGATALAASVTDPSQFSSGRQFAAWLGLTPRQSSSGGKERLGRITKMGDRYLRQLLVVGATALVRYAKQKPSTVDPRFVALLDRKSVV